MICSVEHAGAGKPAKELIACAMTMSGQRISRSAHTKHQNENSTQD